jgi:hypothetical protein
MKALPVSLLPNNDQASRQINSGYMTGHAAFIPAGPGTPGPEDIFEKCCRLEYSIPRFGLGCRNPRAAENGFFGGCSQ